MGEGSSLELAESQAAERALKHVKNDGMFNYVVDERLRIYLSTKD